MMSRFDAESLEEVGRGSTASVYRARRLEDGKEYAVKVFDMSDDFPALSSGRCRSLLNEVQLLAALSSDHPHIVKYRESFLARDQQQLCVVMELLKGETLKQFICRQSFERGHLPEAEIWQLFLQMATAVAHMHALQTAHRDLKPSNCMFASAGGSLTLKIVDMGLAKYLHNGLSSTLVGTPLYAAPEIFNRQPYGMPCDVWSLGCILFELVALRPAFDAVSIKALRFKVLRGTIEPLPEQYSQDLKDIVAAMLLREPAQRITMEQLLRHPAVAWRLDQLQAQGLVGSPRSSFPSLALPATTPAHASPYLAATRCSGELADDDGHLADLLPPPRYSAEVPAGTVPAAPQAAPSVQVALALGFYTADNIEDGTHELSGPPTAAEHQQGLAAVLLELQGPSSLARAVEQAAKPRGAPAVIKIRVDASGSAPVSQHRQQHQQHQAHIREEGPAVCSSSASARTLSTGAAAAGLPSIQIHPKYAGLIAAAGYSSCGSHPGSPAKAPRSPQRADMLAAVERSSPDSVGCSSGLGHASPAGRRGSPSAGHRPQAAEQRSRGTRRRSAAGDKLAAAVAASLQQEEANALRQLAASVHRNALTGKHSPTVRRALLAAAAAAAAEAAGVAAFSPMRRMAAAATAPPLLPPMATVEPCQEQQDEAAATAAAASAAVAAVPAVAPAEAVVEAAEAPAAPAPGAAPAAAAAAAARHVKRSLSWSKKLAALLRRRSG